ncbi:MAG: guanylate kinase [Polyangia bacterium]
MSQATAPAATRGSGFLLVVSSPSGAGKTTLSRRLLEQHRELRFSVSYTTRPRRPREQEGIDYHFVSDAQFDEMIGQSAFAEWNLVHGRRYGTALKTVASALSAGEQILLDVDYQGALCLASEFPQAARLVYILPPTLRSLEQRLRGRQTDSDSVIEQRLRKARDELRFYDRYHYLVVNDEVEHAYGELEAIYLAEQALARGETPDPTLLRIARDCRCSERAHLAERLLHEAEGTSAAAP